LLEGELQQRLSPGELAFAEDYFKAQGQHMRDTILKELPPNYNQLVRRRAASRSDLEGRNLS
jgi:hypothetical protein